MRRLLYSATILTASVGIAHATPSACISAPASVYLAHGFSCTLDNGHVLADRFNFFTQQSRGGSSTIDLINPISSPHAVGFGVTGDVNTGPVGVPNGSADINAAFRLSGVPFVSDTGTVFGSTTGNGNDSLHVNLGPLGSGNATLTAPLTLTFDPVKSLVVHKDALTSTGSTGFAQITGFTDVIQTTIPEPASLAVLGLGLLSLAGIRVARRRS